MCGILVVFSKRQQADLKACSRALERLSLRGPDFNFSEIYCDGMLYFSQTILSITGNPFNTIETFHKSHNHKFDIVFNGEIYNHQELYHKELATKGYLTLSGTDTETLINLHEIHTPVDVYKILKGMFAYVIYDFYRKRLLIARDIIGEKILYYYEDNDLMILCSEIGPILDLRPSININADILREYFFTRHLLTPDNSVFHGIRLIRPGSIMEYSLKNMRFRLLQEKRLVDYIDPDRIKKNRFRPSDDILEEFESIMTSTAKAITPVDREYFSVFSGGIDSSLASFHMTHSKPPKSLIALIFPGKDKISENIYQFENILTCPLHSTIIDIDSFAAAFDQCYKAACAPLSTHSFVSQAIMSQKVKSNGIKILIGGDGADELFGGYEYYKALEELNSIPCTNPSIYSGFIPSDIKFHEWEPSDLIAKKQKQWSEVLNYFCFENDDREKILQAVLYSDTVVQLESVGIRAADTMSMLNSVESRCFYLYQDVLKFALNLPACYKIDLSASDSRMITKPLLKKSFVRHFGVKLLSPKQGFSGYPNEAGRTMVDSSYPLATSFLGISLPSWLKNKIPQATEWKLINVELFLKYFQNHL